MRDQKPWIPLGREMTEPGDPIFDDPALLRVYLWLRGRASISDREITWIGEIVRIKRGEVITGRRKLAKTLGYSEMTIRTAIRKLKKMKRIKNVTNGTTKRYSKYYVLEIDFFEQTGSENNQVGNQELTKRQPSDNQQNTTDQYCNNGKCKNVKKYSFGIEHAELAEYLRTLILENFPTNEISNGQKWGARSKQWANTIRLMVERDSRTVEEIRGVLDWSQKDSFWSGVILSAGSLRKNYDKLSAKMNRKPEGEFKNKDEIRREKNFEAYQNFLGGGHEKN